jgi:hypothetical protein
MEIGGGIRWLKVEEKKKITTERAEVPQRKRRV